MMADETVSATDSTDDELAAVAGVLYLASAELDDYGASVSEKNGGRWGLPSWEWMREKLDRLEPAKPVWEALSEGVCFSRLGWWQSCADSQQTTRAP
jgi:hypothetical protein